MGDFSSSVSLSGPVRVRTSVHRSVRHNFILVTFGEWRKKCVVCMHGKRHSGTFLQGSPALE